MAHGSDSNDTSYNKSPSPASQPGSSDDKKKVMRREKNRLAAQKSRQKQTQRADTLHLDLEKVNAALRKEVRQLTDEKKYLSSMLSSHEPMCMAALAAAPQTPEPPVGAAADQHGGGGGGGGYPHTHHHQPHHQPHHHQHHQHHQHHHQQQQQQHLAAGPHYQL
ncbi:hypothetical protein CRUP_015717 [Coryphaenoides rupestris]|nr:hypothetical protein CRUP_015717 [Coryphaenoides rupestris]